MIGDFLYSLTPRDQQASLIESALASRLLVLASASFSVAFRVPQSQIFLLNAFQARATGTGGQLVTVMQLRIQRLDQVAWIRLAPLSAGVADVFLGDSFDHLVCMPNDIIELQCSYSAGAVNNSAQLDLHGVLIPRGTLGYGNLIQL